MEVNDLVRIRVTDASDAGEARRMGSDMAERLGFGETDVGRVAIVATEIATNLVKHAGGGELILSTTRQGEARTLTLISLDRGPGIGRVQESLRDGFSTSGTAGNGLGAVARLSDRFDVYSAPGHGTAILAELTVGLGDGAESGLAVGGMSVPVKGETVCGDAWAVIEADGRAVLLVVDGLGHGAGAAEAAGAAVQAFAHHAALAPEPLLERLHGALRATRGAAAAVAELDRRRGVVRFAGVGNVAATMVTDAGTRSLVSLHGTLGHDVRKLREFQYPWTPGVLLVMASDGLVSHWTLDAYAGLAHRHPALVAGVLYRDFQRGRDDTTVVVLREAR
jgi:anti-sigma regulatory factor (Ser/Thr protein kinase)